MQKHIPRACPFTDHNFRLAPLEGIRDLSCQSDNLTKAFAKNNYRPYSTFIVFTPLGIAVHTLHRQRLTK